MENNRILQKNLDTEHQTDSRSLSSINPGKSSLPPNIPPKNDGEIDFLCFSIGKGGQNEKSDIQKLAMFFKQQGAPPFFIDQIAKPETLGNLIERYQSEVLHFSKPDGRADPGGKTIKAILNLEGKAIVDSWFLPENRTKKNISKAQTNDQGKKEGANLEEGESWIIEPLLSPDNYITQAPPSQAAGAKTLTKEQLFTFGLSDYGPGKSRDIKIPENWPNHYKWKSKGPWTTYEEALVQTYWIGCHNTCIYMAQSGGVSGVATNSGWDSKMEMSETKGKTASALIDPQLESGAVVVVRVLSNAHSILIVGKGKDENGAFYYFFDPGRTGTKGYDLKKNRLYISDTAVTGGDKSYKTYSVSNVRQSTLSQ